MRIDRGNLAEHGILFFAFLYGRKAIVYRYFGMALQALAGNILSGRDQCKTAV
jgi:hypothetical protein